MSDFHLGKYGLRLLQNVLTDNHSPTFYRGLEKYLRKELQADEVTVKKCKRGSHWISVPFKVNVRTCNESQTLFVKVLTEKGLRNFNYAIESRNLRILILANLCGLRYKKAGSKQDVLTYEAATLMRFKAARICAPTPLKVFDTEFYSLLMLEYIKGTPLGGGILRQGDAERVLHVVKHLWDSRLVHGDIKLDNFIRTKDGSIYLSDCLNWTGSRQAAMYYDLASALLCLSRKLEPYTVLKIAHQFFTALEIREVLPLIDLAGVQLDALTDEDRARQIKTAMQSF